MDDGDASFFKCAPIAQDLHVSEGMLSVNYMLSWADSITNIFMMSRLKTLKLTLFFRITKVFYFKVAYCHTSPEQQE